MGTDQENRSVGALLRDLANDVTALIRQELMLARTETQDKLHQTITAVVAMIAGALVAFAALIILLDALVYGLTEAGLQRWLAALIVGGVVAIIAFALIYKGMNDLKASSLAPTRTVEALRRDAHMVKEHAQ